MKHFYCWWLRLAMGLGIILLPEVAYALDPAKGLSQFNCQNWTRRSGLPANGVSAIAQTKDGYLWLGTQKGLIRFDGDEFKLFSLPDWPLFRRQSIGTLSPSADGGLWFGISGSAFGYFDGQDKFATIGAAPWVRSFMNAVVIRELTDGSLWVGADAGAARFMAGSTNASFIADQIGSITAVCEGAQGRVWLGTSEHGLYYWEQGNLIAFPDALLKGTTIRALAADQKGQIWVGTSAGLRCYNAAFELQPALTTYTEVKVLLTDRQGSVWIGTSGDGLGCYRNGQLTFLRRSDGLVNDFVTALFQDREGSLWVGTREGLSHIGDVKLPILSAAEGLPPGMVHGVAVAQDGGLWVATGMGVSKVGQNGVTKYAAESGLSNLYVKQLFESRSGDLYTITGDKKIEILAAGRVVARHAYPNTNAIWPIAFAEDSQGMIAAVGGDLFRISREQLVPYVFKPGPTPFYWIRDLLVTRDDALWVASTSGIHRIKDGEVEQWIDLSAQSKMSAHSLIEDADGAIWGGLATGIVRIKQGQVSQVDRSHGLLENFVFAMALDAQDRLWANSSSGIYRVSRRDLNAVADGRTNRLECVAFDGLDSVKTTDTTEVELMVAQTPDGRIWLPSPQGVIQIDPLNIFSNQVAPPVQFQRVRINGTDVSFQKAVNVPPGKGELEINYVALSFISPLKIRYRYQLEGYDPTWVEAGGRQSAFYTNLKPGQYRFRVQACNADGIWNEQGGSINFELQAHYFQTAWFKGLAGLLAACLLAGIYLWRFRHLRNKQKNLHAANARLESKVQERTNELAAQHNLLRTLIDHLPDNVFVKDTQNRVVLSNQAHALHLGADNPQAIVGKTDYDFFPPAIAEPFIKSEQQVLATGEPYNAEETSLNVVTGKQRWSRTTKVPLRDREGKIIGLAGINRDITERKQWEARLESLHHQLVAASRQAGMAEVATSVLHNVGNVLNSVNISATVVADRVKHSAANQVERVLQLLQEHQPDLAQFLSQADKGGQLLRYLEALVKQLAAEKTGTLEELNCLARNIDHIKEIVTLQQANAHLVGVHEIVNPTDLVEAAIGMQAAAFTRHHIRLRREFVPVPAITIDRHQVIQILVNLLQNAKRACAENTAVPGEIIVRVGRSGAARVQIEVADNGVGIPAENLTRIFSHGFTTRKNGHGFGLHSGALAAQQMGGSLQAFSAGPGQGARFMLELPGEPGLQEPV